MDHVAHRTIFGLLPVLLLSCHDGNITDARKESDTIVVRDSAMDTLPTRIDFTERNTRLRATLAQQTCTEWKLRGDLLHSAMRNAAGPLERMRAALEQRPIDDERVADSVYLADDGEHLFSDLHGFYTTALHSAADTSALRRAETLSMQVLSFPSADAWREQCFMHVPRVATSTILSKISTDMLLLENICLHSILKECERSVGGSPFPEPDTTGTR